MGRHPSHLAERRRSEARSAIIAAAHDQVARGGYASAGVQAVAARAGVATGSIYRHFPSKGELFAEVFRDAAGRELAYVTAIAEDHGRLPAERLAAAIEAFARRALAAPTLAHALMAEAVDPGVEAARRDNKRAYRDVFAALLEEGVVRREMGPLDPPVIAAALVGALQEALIGPLVEGRASDALVASLVSFALNAVNVRGRHADTTRRAADRA